MAEAAPVGAKPGVNKKVFAVAAAAIVLAGGIGVGVAVNKNKGRGNEAATADDQGNLRAGEGAPQIPSPEDEILLPEDDVLLPEIDEPMMPEEEEEEEMEGPEEVMDMDTPPLVWADEFDDAELNEDIWYQFEGDGCNDQQCGFGNAEAQFYLPEACEVVDGVLTMTASPTTNLALTNGEEYSSCKVITRPDYNIQNGRIEIRAKVPREPGAQTSFHLVPPDPSTQDWPNGGFGQGIEILEVLNVEEPLSGALHYGTELGFEPYYKGQSGCRFDNGAALDDDFHTYALEWGDDVISWLFDDQVYCTSEARDWMIEGVDELPFNMPFQLEMRLTVDSARTKGLHLNTPSVLDDTTMPWTAEIDYVRVYEHEEEAAEYEPLFPGEPLIDPDAPARRVAVPYNNDEEGMPAPWQLPCRINAEAFDEGGQGVGFFDFDPQVNSGDSAIRPFTGVDIFSNAYEQDTYEWLNTEGAVVNLKAGEWLQYTVEVGEDELLKVAAYFSTAADNDDEFVEMKVLADSKDCLGSDARVAINGGQVLTKLYSGPTGAPQTFWQAPIDLDAAEPLPALEAGVHTIVFCTKNDINLSHLVFSSGGVMEAEVAAAP
ncbi:unnamed protein product [Chrysoparadoxa australica]